MNSDIENGLKPERSKEIISELDRLTRAIKWLEGGITEIGERLEPVLRTAKLGATHEDKDASDCPMVTCLMALTTRVTVIGATITCYINRLEL